MLNKVLEFLHASPGFREAFDARQKGVSALYEMAEGQRPFYAAMLARETGRPVLYIAPSEAAAMRAADDCGSWLGGGVFTLPAPDARFTRGTASRENAFQRLAVLQRVRRGDVQVLCACADAVQSRMLPPAEYEKNAVQLSSGSRMEPGELIERLVEMGYERVDMVEGRGQCALRGAIVDAFSPAESGATRIEFWDDEVDSIRSFDPISQRSLDRMGDAAFCPAVISSRKPFSLPRCRCCCPKYFPDCVATLPLVNRIPEVMTRVIAVRGMFRMHMLTKTLTILVREFMSCGKAMPMNCLRVSVSFV